MNGWKIDVNPVNPVKFPTKHLPVTDVVIQAENLGKKHTTGHQTENGRGDLS